MSAVRRTAALFTIGGMLAAGALADVTVGADSNETRSRREHRAVLPASIPAEAPRTSAWYCASGVAGGDAPGQLTVRITNVRLAAASARLRVTGGAAEVERAVEIAPGASTSFNIGELVETNTPGVIVEVSSGSVVVDEWVQGANDAAWMMCATRPSPSWYLPAGTAELGTVSRLALFNPFSEAAIVKVQFQTDVGLREPFDLQSFVVPPRGRVDIDVDEVLGNPSLAAAIVQARTGRIVAQRYEVLTDSLRGSGITGSAGNVSTSDQLMIAFPGRQSSDRVIAAVSNTSDQRTVVNVTIRQPGSVEAVVKPVTIEAQHATEIDLTNSITAGAAAVVALRSTAAVVGELRWWELTPDSTKVAAGVAVLPMSPISVKEWFLPLKNADSGTVVTVANDQDARAHLRLTSIAPDGAKRLRSVNVPPHSVLNISQSGVTSDTTAIRVQASVPVVVVGSQRTAASDGVIGVLAATVGVPVD